MRHNQDARSDQAFCSVATTLLPDAIYRLLLSSPIHQQDDSLVMAQLLRKPLLLSSACCLRTAPAVPKPPWLPLPLRI
jgi:hypothetical protein